MENKDYWSPSKDEEAICFSDKGAEIEIAMSYDMGFGMTWESLDESKVQELVYFLQGWLDKVRKDKLNVRG